MYDAREFEVAEDVGILYFKCLARRNISLSYLLFKDSHQYPNFYTKCRNLCIELTELPVHM